MMSKAEIYMALFNEIDKYLDQLLKTENFMPYNEKLKEIAHGRYPISKFVRLHDHTLKYFGELRNMISHGLKLNGKIYADPSDFAIQQITTYREAILRPVTAKQLFSKKVVSCAPSDQLSDLISLMKKIGHVPVFDQWKLVSVVTLETLCQWLDTEQTISPDKIQVSDLPLAYDTNAYRFVHPSTTIYEVELIFEVNRKKWKLIEALLITPHGKPSEQLLWIITSSDLPLIMDKLLLSS